MQRSASVLLLFVLLLALGGAAAFWWGDPAPSAEPDPEPAAGVVAQPDESPGEAMQAGLAEQTPEVSGESAEPGAERQAVEAIEVPPDTPRVRLRGRLVHPGNVAATGIELGFLAGRRQQAGGAEVFLPFLTGTARSLPKDAPRAKSDGDGSFELAVPAGFPGTLVLLQSDHLFEREENERVLPAREDVDLGVLGLIPGAEIAGVVKDRAGAGQADVRISLLREFSNPLAGGRMFMPFPGPSAKSDAEGRFALRGVRPGKYELRTQSSRHVPASRYLEIERGEKEHGLELLLEDGAMLAGRVVDDAGRPVPGMRVQPQRSSPRGEVMFEGFQRSEPTVTDEQGRFQIGGLTDAKIGLRVSGPGHATAVRRDVPVGAGDVVVEVQRHGGIHGEIRDGSGVPVAGSDVRWRAASSGLQEFSYGGGGERSVKSAADGSFELKDVPPGRVVVVASGAEHVEAESLPIDVRPAQVQRDVRIVVQRGATLEVRVADGNGQPVADALVSVLAPDEERGFPVPGAQGQFTRRMTLRASFNGDILSSDSAQALASARTDKNGVARLGGLRAGNFLVTAEHSELVGKDRRHVTLPALGEVKSDLVMVRGGHLDVRVLDAAGKPAPGQEVLVELAGSADAEPKRARSGADGRARVGPLLPGQYQATLGVPQRPQQAGGFAIMLFGGGPQRIESTRRNVRIDEAEVATLTLHKPLLARVEGTVADAGGVVAGAEVTLRAEGQPRMPGLGSPYSAKTDPTGLFVIEDLPAGKYTLTWSRPGALVPSEETIELADGQHLTRSLSIPGGKLTVRVVDAEGEPLRGAQVSLATGGGTRERAAFVFRAVASDAGEETQGMELGGAATARTDEDGRATLQDLPAGKYSVEIRHRMHVPKSIPDVQIADPDLRDLGTVPMTAGGSIRGSLLDASEQPVPFAMVVLTPAAGGREQRSMAQNGAFRFDSLAPGKYRVRAEQVGPNQPGARPQETEVEVRAGPPTPVRLKLE
jgi:protocatechuate 3,4-dioxygenase beta subunit